MIDHKNHYERYNALMSIVSGGASARRKDGGYMSALYILSADGDLFRMARPCFSAIGIDFKRLLAAARRAEVTASQLTAVKAAHNLFNSGSASITPHDLAQCDYDTLDAIADAFYIWKGGRSPVQDENGRMRLDTSAEQRSRSFGAALYLQLAAMQQAAGSEVI